MATKIQLNELQREFHWVDPQKIIELFQTTDRVDFIRDHLNKYFPAPPKTKETSNGVPSKSRLTKYISLSEEEGAPILWQSTGSSLSMNSILFINNTNVPDFLFFLSV